ncbi:hypothetical protein ZWY2020_037551 [Hordeum vulgare]|nr:hypothetical protein ZWY2020_037551 [Hordeum vulgare]
MLLLAADEGSLAWLPLLLAKAWHTWLPRPGCLTAKAHTAGWPERRWLLFRHTGWPPPLATRLSSSRRRQGLPRFATCRAACLWPAARRHPPPAATPCSRRSLTPKVTVRSASCLLRLASHNSLSLQFVSSNQTDVSDYTLHFYFQFKEMLHYGIKSDEEPDLAGIFEPTEPSAEVEETLHNIQDEQSTYADDEECRIFSGQGFDPKTLGRLSDLIDRSLHQDIPDDDSEQLNQKQFIASGYRRWADRFPGVRNVVHQHVSV